MRTEVKEERGQGSRSMTDVALEISRNDSLELHAERIQEVCSVWRRGGILGVSESQHFGRVAGHTEQKQTRVKAELVTCISGSAPAEAVSAWRVRGECGEKADPGARLLAQT